VFGPHHCLGRGDLRRILKCYTRYYDETRTHLALDRDAPLSRTVMPEQTSYDRYASLVDAYKLLPATSILLLDLIVELPEAHGAFGGFN
jgi:hypothetical protein